MIESNNPIYRFLIVAACVVIIVAGIKAVAPILNIVLLALMLSEIIRPMLAWLMKKRIPSLLSVLIIVVCVLIGGSAVISLLGISITQLTQRLPEYQAQLMKLQETVNQFLRSRGVDIARLYTPELVSPAKIFAFTGSFLGSVASILGDASMLLFVVILLLLKAADEQGSHPDSARPKASVLVLEISNDVRKYIAITGLSGSIQVVAIIILLKFASVDFAFTWGVLFFFLNFIPVIGFFIAIVPPVLLAILQHGWQTALVVGILYYGINFVGDNVLRPKFMKKGLDISLLTIILSLVFWGWVLGPIGTILAVPLTLTIKKTIAYYHAPEPQRDSLPET